MLKKPIIQAIELLFKKVYLYKLQVVMSKHLILILLLLLCTSGMYAQSIKFSDLVYFTSLSNGEVYNNLIQGKAFRQDYTEDENGQELEYFKNIANKPNTEEIITGSFTKLYDGTKLRTIVYTSTDGQNIINMISQAKRYGLELKFRGTDASNNIYLYDNNFYHVSIYLKLDKTSGMVEIKQKELLGLE
ncbi:MAG TPA: hypothetical protein DCO83_13860 [Mucilaginibacter sp.]|nr:hypothetical protein [Mucilaginibacter sp.]